MESMNWPWGMRRPRVIDDETGQPRYRCGTCKALLPQRAFYWNPWSRGQVSRHCRECDCQRRKWRRRQQQIVAAGLGSPAEVQARLYQLREQQRADTVDGAPCPRTPPEDGTHTQTC